MTSAPITRGQIRLDILWCPYYNIYIYVYILCIYMYIYLCVCVC